MHTAKTGVGADEDGTRMLHITPSKQLSGKILFCVGVMNVLDNDGIVGEDLEVHHFACEKMVCSFLSPGTRHTRSGYRLMWLGNVRTQESNESARGHRDVLGNVIHCLKLIPFVTPKLSVRKLC